MGKPSPAPEISTDEFVVVTIEEVELSLSTVVAVPDDDSDDERSDAALEARVVATQQVAAVHEFELLRRARAAQNLAARLTGGAAVAGGGGDARLGQLESTLRAAAGDCRLSAEVPDAAAADAAVACAAAALGARDDPRGVAAAASAAPVRVSVAARGLAQAAAAASAKDGGEAQARRDIERDRLVLDGGDVVEGGRVGYDRVVDRVVAAAARLVGRADARAWRSVDDGAFRAFGEAALRAANRTESGGVSLEAVTLALDARLEPVPDARAAEPLRVSLALGPARAADGAWRWGLKAHVAGSTGYRLFAPGDFDDPLLRARCAYANTLCLPLDGLRGDAVLYDRQAARIDVEFYGA